MSLSAAQVTVIATTHTALHAACPSGWLNLTITNASTTIPLYLGASGVVEASGFKVPHGTVLQLKVPPGDVLYASSTANTTVSVLRASVST